MHAWRKFGAVGALSLAAVFGSSMAHAIGAPAGTVINNTAEVSYSVDTVNRTATSNLVTVTVAEILDVVVTAQTPTVDVDAGETQRAVRYLVSNTGNGTETFLLTMTSVITGTGDEFDPVPATPAIYLDDGDGIFDSGDTPYSPGGNDPVLGDDDSVVAFVVNDIPAGVVDGDEGMTRLTAAARTGTGAAGTVFAGQGDGGVDAVVGNTGADSEATSEYEVSTVNLTVTKSQTVSGAFGAAPVPTAQITYSIVVNVTGSETADNVVLVDNIPANTTYVPGSLTLNSVALTDAASDDAGEYSAAAPARVSVTLGNLTTGSGPQTVTFAVTIN